MAKSKIEIWNGAHKIDGAQLELQLAQNVGGLNKSGIFAFNDKQGKTLSREVSVLAEFDGVRANNINTIKDDIYKVLARTFDLVPAKVELVPPNWLKKSAKGVIDRKAAFKKYQNAKAKKAKTGEIVVWTHSNNIPESKKDAFIYFGAHSKIRTPTEVAAPSHIQIGNWVSFGRYGKILMQTDFSASIDHIKQHYPEVKIDFDSMDPVIFGKRNPILKIGDGTTIGDNFLISCGCSIEIGKHVGIANRVFIADSRHFFEHPDLPILMQSNTLGKPMKIGDHTWIGINVAILEGANIGKHCIISAGSVVTGDVPDYGIVAGNPARLVKIIPH